MTCMVTFNTERLTLAALNTVEYITFLPMAPFRPHVPSESRGASSRVNTDVTALFARRGRSTPTCERAEARPRFATLCRERGVQK